MSVMMSHVWEQQWKRLKHWLVSSCLTKVSKYVALLYASIMYFVIEKDTAITTMYFIHGASPRNLQSSSVSFIFCSISHMLICQLSRDHSITHLLFHSKLGYKLICSTNPFYHSLLSPCNRTDITDSQLFFQFLMLSGFCFSLFVSLSF